MEQLTQEIMQTYAHLFRKYDIIYLLGASHMERTYLYLASQCKLDNISLLKLRHAVLFQKSIQDIIGHVSKESMKDSKLLFVLQTGTWDLCYITFSYHHVFTAVLEKYKTAIEMLIRFNLHRRGDTDIFILAEPVRKNKHRLAVCNNFVVSIFNELVREYVHNVTMLLRGDLNAGLHVPKSPSWDSSDSSFLNGKLHMPSSDNDQNQLTQDSNTWHDHQASSLEKYPAGKVSLEFLDLYDLTLPVSQHTVLDNIHYMQCPHKKCQGVVGEIMNQLLMSRVKFLQDEH